MFKNLILTIDAEYEIEDAYQYYYEEGSESVALRFMGETENCLRQISEAPDANPIHMNYSSYCIRKIHLSKNFPYTVYYFVVADEIKVFAVIHQSRNQSIITKRLASLE